MKRKVEEGKIMGSHEMTKDRQDQPSNKPAVWSAFLAAAAIVSTIVLGAMNLSATHNGAVREDRVQAYSLYGAQVAAFHEFVWSNTYWAGSDSEVVLTDAQVATFWDRAQALAVDLESTYLSAQMVAGRGDVSDSLERIHAAQSRAFLQFKCTSGVQPQNCELDGARVAEGTQAEVLELLAAWSSSWAEERSNLIEQTREHTN